MDKFLVKNDTGIKDDIGQTAAGILDFKDCINAEIENAMDTSSVQNVTINNNELTTSDDLNSKDGLDVMTKNIMNKSLVQNVSSIKVNGLSATEIQNYKGYFVQIERLNLDTINGLSVKNTEEDLKAKFDKFSKFYQDYVLGDIIWAKLQGYPYWPGVICLNPESMTYIRGKQIHFKIF